MQNLLIWSIYSKISKKKPLSSLLPDTVGVCAQALDKDEVLRKVW